MQAHTVERVESWDSRPFSGGFRELHDLADREFSGAVVVEGAWLFMLNGRVIGVFEGGIDDFEDASGTVYEAPHPSLALLFSMQERGGETQAKYYTNDTPLSEASETLSDASFTGYIELSENVLSGDYYVVYYGGRSMSAAFVGASEELITDDEAFERADDEVGVYEVIKTPVNVTSIPDVEDDEDDPGTEVASAGGGAAAGADETAEPDAKEPEKADAAPSGEDTTEPDPRDESAATPAADPTPAPSEQRATDAESDTPAPVEEAESAATETAEAASKPSETDDEQRDATATRRRSTPDDDAADEADETPATGKARTGEPDRMFDEEEEWRNAKSVPTLDPEKSESTDGGGATSKSSSSKQSTQSRPSRSAGSGDSAASGSGGQPRSGSGGAARSTVEKLKRAVKQRDAKLEEASDRIEDLRSEREDLRERVQTLERERDELQATVDELEAELEAAREADTGSEAPTGADLTPEAALSGTNLFVRYDSKGKPTLDGLDANTDPSAVNDNLRIDHHTQFEAADASVDGDPFETFLRASASYRFVSWAVRELPYEIRDAGHANGLGDLYEAIPAVDRAELDGTVEVESEEGSVTESFDVVLRDRMGDPLVVAELNAEREPVTGHEMEDLVDAATAVREGADELSAAMYVTASFFEPAALETADEETGGGGFLSRSDKESFVNVGRKSGYHLCLVEDRNDAFHLTVPEL